MLVAEDCDKWGESLAVGSPRNEELYRRAMRHLDFNPVYGGPLWQPYRREVLAAESFDDLAPWCQQAMHATANRRHAVRVDGRERWLALLVFVALVGIAAVFAAAAIVALGTQAFRVVGPGESPAPELVSPVFVVAVVPAGLSASAAGWMKSKLWP